MIRTYLVDFKVTGSKEADFIKTSQVTTSPARNTSFKDIPKILAVKRGVSEDVIEIVSLMLLDTHAA